MFEVGAAALGNGTTRASDRLPVYAEFVFGAEGTGEETPPGALRIAALLPKPEGDDGGQGGGARQRRRRPSAGRQLAAAGPGGNEFALADRDGDPGFWVSRTLTR